MDIEIIKLRLYQGLSEDLRKWFKDGGWNRYNTKGEKVGKCARDDKDGDGKADGPKPKCLPSSKAASLGKKKVAAAVKRKRSEDPNPNRTGAAKNVKTESAETITFQQFQEKAQKCWDTHKKVGMKMKGGKMVNDCRPKNEEVEQIDELINPKINFPLGGDKIVHSGGGVLSGAAAAGLGALTAYGLSKLNKKKEKKKVNEGAAWTKKSGKSESGGLNEKGRKSYEAENPGSDLKAPSKKKGNKRRASFCARMKGMRKRQKPSNNTGEDRLSKSLRAWNC